MAIEQQIAANRANAAHSTGPRTPEGKTASFRKLVLKEQFWVGKEKRVQG